MFMPGMLMLSADEVVTLGLEVASFVGVEEEREMEVVGTVCVSLSILLVFGMGEGGGVLFGMLSGCAVGTMGRLAMTGTMMLLVLVLVFGREETSAAAKMVKRMRGL